MPAQIDLAYARARPSKVVSRLVSYALFEGRPATTRGRWINPLLFAAFGFEKRLPAIRRVVKPVFILGTGRSGTTVLGRVLSMHRDVGFLNEPKALWHSVHSGEDVVGNYTLDDARYRLGAADAGPEVRRAARRLYSAYLASTLSRRVVDKYPEMVFRVPFVTAIFPDARFVVLVRNGWDTCASIERWSEVHGERSHEGTVDWWGIRGRKWGLLQSEILAHDPELADLAAVAPRLERHIDMAAVEWIVTMREALAASDSLPGRILQVRYEQLTESPREELGRIADFCEFRYDSKYLDYGAGLLRPSAPRGPLELHSAVMPRFLETMDLLGY